MYNKKISKSLINAVLDVDTFELKYKKKKKHQNNASSVNSHQLFIFHTHTNTRTRLIRILHMIHFVLLRLLSCRIETES